MLAYRKLKLAARPVTILLLVACFISLPGTWAESVGKVSNESAKLSIITPASPQALNTNDLIDYLPGSLTAFLNQGNARIRTDHAVYAEPALPTLPRAGGKFIDPVFGSQIMRVTDEADGSAPGLGTYYSHWPTFNSNNTRLLIRKGVTGQAILKEFDPVNFRLSAGSTTLPDSLPGGGGPSWESSIWSNIDPNIIYTFSGYYYGGMKLYSYNVQTKAFTLIKDLSYLGQSQDYLKQMYMSKDDDTFCWLQHRAGVNDGQPIGYIVYRRSSDRVLYHNSALGYVGGINEVHVDKSGKWLHIVIPTKQADGTGTRVMNLETGQTQAFVKEVDHTPGHGDLGTETIIGFDNYEGAISKRRLDKIHAHTIVLRFQTLQKKTDWTNDFHGTMLADDESWMTIGTYDETNDPVLVESGIFEDEIMQVSLDGSQRIRRLCHTRSSYDGKTETSGYWSTPKPTVSKDGKYIAFTSNWEKSGRYDLFVVKVEPAESLLPKPAPATPFPTQRQRRVRPV